ncbi:MAG: cysteine desulfurase [Clostridiales bacterium]|nr:cysteine desulfurase [Clostridiales bacterium]
MRKIYADHAATTPVFPQAIDGMAEFMRSHIGNPSSVHAMGRDARQCLEHARGSVAALIGAPAEQVYFTSGGTEANNMAIFGTAKLAGRGHIITGATEHHAVLDPCRHLAGQGFELTVLDVDGFGMVDPAAVKKALRPDTVLVSIMHANNEVGTVNPIAEIGALVREAGAVFHVDAVQSAGKIPIDVGRLPVDMLTFSSHKINGPKGVGALYKRPETRLVRLTYGGGQEKKVRSGTENLSGIVGFGLAAELTRENMAAMTAEWAALRDRLIRRVLSEIPHSHLNGHPGQRTPHNANLSCDFVEGEALLLILDSKGVCCSAGSACSSDTSEPSHVLTAIGLSDERKSSALRFSFGLGNTAEEVDYIVDVLKEGVERLRRASPFYSAT